MIMKGTKIRNDNREEGLQCCNGHTSTNEHLNETVNFPRKLQCQNRLEEKENSSGPVSMKTFK